MLAVLAARWPLTDVTLIPVPVQGAEAAPAMISALALLNRQTRLDPAQDAVLITRGGGSLEDLWAFNDEHLARAIFHSNLPVMAAIGHEVDVTLAEACCREAAKAGLEGIRVGRKVVAVQGHAGSDSSRCPGRGPGR